MMKTAVFASLLASAAAFAPQQQSTKSSAVAGAFDKEIGVQAPLNLWDPLGFLDNADDAEFKKLRSAEIKHGRIAMMAIVGHMVTASGVRLPGMEKIPAGVAALPLIPTEVWLQIVATFALLEVAVMNDSAGDFAGDMRRGTFKWSGSQEELNEKRAIEVNNGRAAQMGIIGLIVHENIYNHDPYILNNFLGYPSHFNEGF